MKIKLKETDLHFHIKRRMQQRGITKKEIEKTLKKGVEADDAREGTLGKVYIFPYRKKWIGNFFEEKEVRVYYKFIGNKLVLLTAKARYGKFSEGG